MVGDDNLFDKFKTEKIDEKNEQKNGKCNNSLNKNANQSKDTEKKQKVIFLKFIFLFSENK